MIWKQRTGEENVRRSNLLILGALERITVAALVVFFATSCTVPQEPLFQSANAVNAQSTAAQEFPIWLGVAPGSENWAQKQKEIDVSGTHYIYNVVRPTLMAYFPDPKKATGAAMIVAPGGGFRFLNVDQEGRLVARWLADHGVAAFVLEYRTVKMPDDTVGFATLRVS
jgi:acetyl esterase/lipase